MTSKYVGIAVIVAIGFGIFYLNDQGMLNLTDDGNGGQAIISPIGTATSNQDDIQVYSGSLTMKNLLTDAEDPATSRTDDTNADTVYYKRTDNGEFRKLASSTSNSATVTVDEDLKTVWAEVTVPSGQAFYVDANAIASSHSRVGTPIWADPNLDNKNSYVFPIDITGISTPDPNNTPEFQLMIDLWTDGTLTIDSPSDLSAVGQGKVKNTIKWSADMTAEKTGEAVTEIKITLNQTDSTLWYENDSYIEVPTSSGTQKITLSQMDRSDLSSTTVYKYKYGTDVDTANFFVVAKNGDTEIRTPVVIYTGFDADNEGITITYQLTKIDSQGAYTTTSDAVKVVEQ
tara:strand:+ start:5880 stop:6911 length:1032 start_codon:yes stop_codon:yes gene_type:complete